ncbi:DNA-binding protein [Streptomyces oceani]|uniref:DNA-binding protein n=1 Tax=Streptomyces oceani TaxID=1075402 RepID=A0A1E7KM21_9ACTN|nr:DNA-binding protein [Streptomyces oceani]OEV04947.1 DNA-binding protein [Streptomyces oceani]
MARSPSRVSSGGILVLDSEGLGKAVRADPTVTAFIRGAQSHDAVVAVSDLTLIEAWHSGINMARFRWYVSRLVVLPVTEEISWRAIELLRDAGLHGHKYAIDAVVAASTLARPGPRVILTSDHDDMSKLCGTRVHIEEV